MTDDADRSFRPDYAIPPGATLRDRLQEIDVSQAELAIRSGMSAKHVNQMIQGQAPITPESGLILERVTGLPARLLVALEAQYRETLARQRARVLTKEDRSWLKAIPVALLQKRGVLPPFDSTEDAFEAVLSFFGVADREAWTRVWADPAANFRRSKAFKSHLPIVAAWLRLGELQARHIETAPFTASAFKEALSEIRALTRSTDFSDELVAICAQAGVATVFVPELGGERASGASMWLTPSRGLIQLSDRYKRNDYFWFAFFHEAGHLLLHSKKQRFVDDGGDEDDSTASAMTRAIFVHDGSDDPELEKEADRFAADSLIPRSAAAKLQTLADATDVAHFADEVGIAPGIVVGRLQHDGHWPWSKGNELKLSVRIVSAAP